MENQEDKQTIRINMDALAAAVSSVGVNHPDEILETAKKYRHFILNGEILVPPQPEQAQ